MGEAPRKMRSHWWWRPGWRVGRSFYTWHITFAGHPQFGDFVTHYRDVLDACGTLDRVPISGLHVTLQGIGFTDEVDRAEIDRIVEATQEYCAGLRPLEISVDPPVVDQEGVSSLVQPMESVADLRLALRRGIGDVWGEENIPEDMKGFRPHLSLAYSNSTAMVEDVESALRPVTPVTATAQIVEVSLIDLNRDRQCYEWSEVVAVQLGQQAPSVHEDSHNEG